MGAASDRIGRHPVLVTFTVLTIVTAYPALIDKPHPLIKGLSIRMETVSFESLNLASPWMLKRIDSSFQQVDMHRAKQRNQGGRVRHAG
jgi:hypothetical protein